MQMNKLQFIFYMGGIGTIVICLLEYLYQSPILKNTFKENYDFITPRSFNSRGMVIVKDLCITIENGTTGRLVIYSSNMTGHGTIRSQNNKYQVDWSVEYRRQPVPLRYEASPAYFVKTTCEGNLFHFFQDTLYGECDISQCVLKCQYSELIFFQSQTMDLRHDSHVIKNKGLCPF